MKLNLKQPIMMYESFLNQANEDIATSTATSVVSREVIIQDVDSIINSLETLSKSIVEELEMDEDGITEAGTKKDGPSKLADWLLYAGKYRKMQSRINQMKMNSADLQMAARAEKDPAKKKAANEKKKAIDVQVKELQKMVDDKSKERGPYVAKVLSKTKLEGQFELIKHMSGLSDDPNKTSDLKKRMKEVAQRLKDENAALKKLEKESGMKEKKAKAKKAKGEKNDMNGKMPYEKDAAQKKTSNESLYRKALNDFETIEITEMLVNEGIIDWLRGASKFIKIQKRINQMKMNAFDLGFAAANLGRSAEVADQVSALNLKKKMIEDQIKELQAMLMDRIKDKTPYVNKAVEVARMDGQMALIKHMTGLSDDPGKKKDLGQRMEDLKRRQEEEIVAMQQFKDAAADQEVDVKGDDELIALKNELDAAKEAKGNIDKADKVALAQADLNILDLQMRIKSTQGDTAAVQDLQGKVMAAQKKLTDLKSAPAPAPKASPAPEPAPAPAPKSAPAPAPEPGTPAPAPAPASEPAAPAPAPEPATTTPVEETPEAKAIKAKIAEYEQAIQDLAKNSDKASKDKIAMITAALSAERQKLQQILSPKESLMARAYNVGMEELVLYINEKEDWQLEETALYRKVDTEIKTKEMTTTLNEGINPVMNLTVKEKFASIVKGQPGL